MRFDRFDICEAYYVYAFQYCDSRYGEYILANRIHRRLNKIKFKARPSLIDEGFLSENGREIYDRLVDRQSLTAVNE